MSPFILLPGIKSYLNTILGDNPGIWFRFGEAVGTTAVNELGGVDGTYFGSYALGAPGATGDGNAAVDFSWPNGRVGASSIPVSGGPTTSWSATVWADSDIAGPAYSGGPGGSPSGIFFDMGGTDGGGTQTRFQWFYATEGNLANFGIYDDNGPPLFPTFGSNAGFNGSYHHYALVVNGTSADMFIDGSPFGSTITLSGTITLNAQIPTLVVGANFFSNQGFFDGRMDEFLMFDYALTPAQIQEQYQAGL